MNSFTVSAAPIPRAQTVASREDILARVEQCLASISGVATCARDRGLLETDELPAIILLDGREDAVTSPVPMKSVKMPPSVMRLQPQIFLILPQRDDATNQTVDNGRFEPVGPTLSHWRDAILAALINDPALIGLIGTTGQIVYRGMATDMETGRLLQGELQLFIELHYVWFPPQG